MRELLLVCAGLVIAFALGALFGASFLHLDYASQAPCPRCLGGTIEPVFSPEAEERVLALVDGANESLELEMYLFNYKPLADALVRAKGRGVRVRVILEPRLSDNPNLEMMEYLRSGGVEARWASLDYKLTHTKTLIVDGRKVLVGSTNWSRSALKDNREYSVLIEDSGTVSEFERSFEEDWGKAGEALKAG